MDLDGNDSINKTFKVCGTNSKLESVEIAEIWIMKVDAVNITQILMRQFKKKCLEILVIRCRLPYLKGNEPPLC